MKHAQPWFVVAALRGIGIHVKSTTQSFTANDVAGWDAAFANATPTSRGQALARVALERLHFHKLIARHVPERDGVLRPVMKLQEQWKLTTKGLGTCSSLLREQPVGKGPNPKALSTRLWALLRLRKTLTAEDGAATLIDAGTRDFATAQRLIEGYLRNWAKAVPEVVQISAKPVNGAKRYVMVKEGGEIPPPTKAAAVPLMPAPRQLSQPIATRKEAA